MNAWQKAILALAGAIMAGLLLYPRCGWYVDGAFVGESRSWLFLPTGEWERRPSVPPTVLEAMAVWVIAGIGIALAASKRPA